MLLKKYIMKYGAASVSANQPQIDCFVNVDGVVVINDNYCV